MEKTRVRKGKGYWWIRIYEGIDVCADMDWRRNFSTKNYSDGNYFHTKEEAELMACKLRAVLKGADVIEMPSEEEIAEAACYNDKQHVFPQISGFKDGVNYLKTKIIK